ncbi:Retrovirus-related Pol polyprotein from transposon TNT 1-94 [Vitis vinifera]|uniref:Retrovirus-related Pol polyprotein from transposon TNT 1-94 n=1 Tax=Vitis vinifera TaxID=29760 RepID=A0A438H5D1_VITVI|nr:Retrovirus-related Pol polyprotein from transposon TNT 1-94 [Vitis vinifera]
MGQGYEDHLITQEADIPEIASLKEEFLTVMPLTTDVGDQRIQIDKFFMVLTLIGLRPDLETVRDQILGSSSVPSLDDVFARLLRISSTQTLPSDNTSDSSVLVSQTNSRGGRSVTWAASRTAHVAQSSDPQSPQLPSSSTSQGIFLTDSEYDDYLRYQATKSASVASVAQTGNASTCLTHTSSLGPWILDSGASDHISGPEYGEDDWHRTHLGHPSLSKFQKMVPSFSSLSSLACESCQLGKHTRVSFPKRLNNWAKSPFELVHTDVWGPCRTTSTLGFQYFVTFIDDYSRCTCDNAREYFSTPFTSFMSQPGIIHQSSCAHTPQQNGVAERKNRHLVETARTLLLHNHVPFRFWGDAILTACYLINRMPSSVLHDQIPHSLLFPDQPLYFLPPRVFCCTCFVHILTPGQDKLSARATKCIFLGYSKLQKGYRCYSSETHRYFLSADVTFFEDSPFFSTSESLPVSEVLPLPIISPPDAVSSRPLQVYHHRHCVVIPPSLAAVPADSPHIPSASPAPALPPSTDLPIALRKGWRQAMVDEMAALHSNGTWDLVVLPSGKSTVCCRWVYTVKVGPDGQVDRLKARLVAKGYTQVYGSDYGDTFSPVAKIASGESGLVCKLRHSLYGLKQSPRVWFSRFSSVVQEFGMFHSTADHSVFYYHNSSGQCIYLTKDMGKLKYFLGIEIAQSSSGVVLSQRKYALDILEKPGEPLGDPGRYRRLVGKLNCLIITRPDISFPVSVVSQFLQSPCDSHWDAIIRILRYIKSTLGQGVLFENRGHTKLLVTQMQIGLAHPQIDVPLPGIVFLLEVT